MYIYKKNKKPPKSDLLSYYFAAI